LTAEGSSGVEVAERLFISPRTVETHRANVMRKLALRNQRELVRFAVEQGILRSTR
jgi:DNA-binding CsgD family transcriptional regulator